MKHRPAGSRPSPVHTLLVLSAMATTAAAGTGVLAGAALLSALPEPRLPGPIAELGSLDDAVTLVRSESSLVLAADGSVIGRFQPEEMYTPLKAGALPSMLVAAVVAAEDQRFWEHRGFDAAAITRAALANLSAGGVSQGGSTITQQVVKNLFTTGDRTMARKVQELRAAVAIEERFTKEEILTAYLNTTYFGSLAFGAEAAARTYFRKGASELDLSEAALLAAIIPAPSAYNPRVDPAVAERQRQVVLDRVAQSGAVTPSEVAAARATVPVVHSVLQPVERFAYFLDYVRLYMLEVAGVDPRLLYGAGLEIHTTLDPRIQDAAEQAVREMLGDPEGPSASVVVVSPEDGAVLAVVGGREWDESQVNLALGRLGGGSGRQPGSSFKPFVLAAAFESGWSPRDVVDAPAEYLPRTVVDPLPVLNYDRRGYGRMTLDAATRQSVNTAFVGLTEQVGSADVALVASRLGVSSLPSPSSVGPSIGIGAYETSPLEMAVAYASLAADGRAITPTPIRRVVGPDGSQPPTLPGSGPGDQVVGVDTARLVTATLAGVVEGGTATAATIGRPAAAKTGTSENHENAWLVGYTPQLAAAVWVGYPGGNVAMVDVAGVGRVTGGSIPARIWAAVMGVAHTGLPVVGFPPAPDRPGRAQVGEPVPQDDNRGDGQDDGQDDGRYRDDPRPPTTLDLGDRIRARLCERVPHAGACRPDD